MMAIDSNKAKGGLSPKEACAVDVTIVSHHFWPPLQEEELQVTSLIDPLPCSLAYNNIRLPRTHYSYIHVSRTLFKLMVIVTLC